MNVKKAITLFRYYQQSHHRKRTIDSYQTLVSAFEKAYGNRSLESLQSDEICQSWKASPYGQQIYGMENR